MSEIIITEKVLKELDLIKQIFDKQIEGTLFDSFDIYSNTTLFEIENIKKHLQQRFDNAIDKTLFWKQIKELNDKTESVLNYFENELMTPSNIELMISRILERDKLEYKEIPNEEIKKYENERKLNIISLHNPDYDQLKSKMFELNKDLYQYQAVIVVCEYYVMRMFPGIDSMNIDKELLENYITDYSYTMQSNFSFKDYLKDLDEFLKMLLSVYPIDKHQNNNEPIIKNQLLIALYHYYLHSAYQLQGYEITKNNCVEIAAKHGYKKPKSGKSLFEDWNKVFKYNSNKTGADMVRKLEKVILLLEKYPEAKALADIDLQQAKNNKKRNNLVQ